MEYNANKTENFRFLADFLKSDIKIKEAMSDCVPSAKFGYDLTKHSDKIEENLKYIKTELAGFARRMKSPELEATVMKWYNDAQTALAETGCDYDKMQRFCQKYLTDMDTGFVEKVSLEVHPRRCMDVMYIAEEAKTANELLHFIHKHIVSDDEFMMNMPECERYQHFPFPENLPLQNGIVLYGENPSDFFKKLTESISVLSANGHITDAAIVAVDENRGILCLQDVGHATMISITKEQRNGKDVVFIEYDISKIKDGEYGLNAVKQLPGILPSDINLSTGTAKGRFETSPELAGIALTEVLYNIHCDNNPDKQYRNALDVLLIEAYSTPEGRNIFEKFLENNSVLMQNETLKSALYDKLGVKGDTAISVFSNDNNVDIKKFRDIENVAEKTEKSGSSLKTSVEILRAGFFFETSVETGIRDKYLETLEKDENEKPEFMTENNLEF